MDVMGLTGQGLNFLEFSRFLSEIGRFVPVRKSLRTARFSASSKVCDGHRKTVPIWVLGKPCPERSSSIVVSRSAE
jgi:hypothetical protein